MSIRDATPPKISPLPSSLHSQLRVMDTLCLSTKVVAYHAKTINASQTKDLENLQLSLHRGLMAFIQKELKENGYTSDAITERESIDGNSSHDFYTFGILYLTQDLLLNMDHSDLHNVMINNALKAARISRDAAVQSKAFELLAWMSRKPDIGPTTTQLVEQCLEYEDWPVETRDVAAIQWELMSVKALQMDQYMKRVRVESRKLANWSSVRYLLKHIDCRKTMVSRQGLHPLL
jgi:hypothetical protein